MTQTGQPTLQQLIERGRRTLFGYLGRITSYNVCYTKLLRMRERVEALGGTFEIETEPGHGTSVHARIPLVARLRDLYERAIFAGG